MCGPECVKVYYSECEKYESDGNTLVCKFSADDHTKCGMGTVLHFKFKDQTKSFGKFQLLDKELCLKCLDWCPGSFVYFPREMQMDDDLIKTAFKDDEFLYDEMSKEMKSDRSFNIKLVTIDGSHFEDCEIYFSDDVEMLKIAMKTCPYMVVYASDRIHISIGLDKDLLKSTHSFKGKYEDNGFFSKYAIQCHMSSIEDSLTHFTNLFKNSPKELQWGAYLLRRSITFAQWSAIGKESLPKLDSL